MQSPLDEQYILMLIYFYFFHNHKWLCLLYDLYVFQAISSMLRAQEADPRNLEVLLALGVSHTNG